MSFILMMLPKESIEYINSQFMGHATAADIMNDFKEAHKGLDIVNNLIQLSMDGPRQLGLS